MIVVSLFCFGGYVIAQNFIEFGNLNVYEIIFFFSRSIYYFGFLLMIGWIIWWRIIQQYSSVVRKKYYVFGIVFQCIHFVGLLLLYLMDMDIITTKGILLPAQFPFDLINNCLWFVSFVASILGLFILLKHSKVDLIWVLFFIVCKSIDGHPAEFHTTLLLTFFNSVHIVAASIWVAGMVFILLFWRKQKLIVKNFVNIFSEYVVFCIVVLAITGSSLAYVYLPDVYLFLEPWGILILVKSIFACILAFVSIYLKQLISIQKWLLVQFVLMIVIIVFVSVITYIQPMQ